MQYSVKDVDNTFFIAHRHIPLDTDHANQYNINITTGRYQSILITTGRDQYNVNNYLQSSTDELYKMRTIKVNNKDLGCTGSCLLDPTTPHFLQSLIKLELCKAPLVFQYTTSSMKSLAGYQPSFMLQSLYN